MVPLHGKNTSYNTIGFVLEPGSPESASQSSNMGLLRDPNNPGPMRKDGSMNTGIRYSKEQNTHCCELVAGEEVVPPGASFWGACAFASAEIASVG
jgi:hypothetical protein